MNDLLQRLEIFFERMPDRVRERRRGIWAFLVVLSAVMAAGIPHFKINMATVEYFEKDDPVRVAYDRFRAQFGGDENLYLVYEPKDKDLFSRASLRAVTALQEELLDIGRRSGPERSAALDRIVDVKTLVNATYIDTREGDLVSRQFIGTRLPRTDSDKHHLRLGALAHPDYPSLYISGDGRFGGIVIRTDIGATIAQDIILDKTAALGAIDGAAISAVEDEAAIDYDAFVEVDLRRRTPSFELAEIGDYSAVMEAVRRVLEKPQYSDHLVFHAAGNLPVMNYFDRIILEEMVIIGGLSLCVVVAVLFFLFRSLAAVVWPPVIVNLCFLWIVGLVGWSGATMTFMINIIVFLIISVGVADAVHILSGYLFFRQRGQEHRAALRSVFKKSGLACLLTSLTTSIGLLALTLVPIVPIRNFGIFAALGIMLAFVFTMVLLPLMLDLRSPYPRPRAEKNHGRLHPVQRILRKVETLGYRRPRAVVAGFLIAGAGLFYGALQVKVDSNTVELLGPDTTVRQDVDFVDATMGGVQSAEVFIDAGRAGALEDPEVLIKLEQLQNYVESRYPRRVGATHSLADVTKTTFRALNEGRDEMFRIPRDARVLQQTLAIFNNANPKDRRLLVSDDYSRARITITMKNGGTHDYIPIMDDIQATAEALFSPLKSAYPALDVRLTGSMALLIRLDDYISWSQLKSFGLALLVITVLLLFLFGSVKIGAVAIFPNLFPILTAFGVMGLLALPLDADTLLVAPIIIGIAVDDTIHFLIHYRAGMRRCRAMSVAVRDSMREAGQAICFTTLTLALGYLTFLLSSHSGMRHFGAVSATAVVAALLADLLLLPALCRLCRADFAGQFARDRVPSAERIFKDNPCSTFTLSGRN